MRRACVNRARLGTRRGWSLHTTPLLLLMWTLASAVATTTASAQSVWVLGNTPAASDRWITSVTNLTLDNPEVPSDPIPPGVRLEERVITEINRYDYPEDGGITIDRFRGHMWLTNGDRDDLKFWSRPIDPADVGGHRVVEQIAGTYPFGASNINGIAVMHGFNGRPKRMYCVSWDRYSYIEMRGGTWTWASGPAVTIPNGGYPVEDIEFGILEVPNGSQWDRHAALFACESSGLVYAWDVDDPASGMLVSSGAGLYEVSGITLDTSKPVRVVMDAQGNRRVRGRVLAIGELGGQTYVRDIDNHRVWAMDYTGDRTLGMTYSAQLTSVTDFLPGVERTGVTTVLQRTDSTPAQPIVRMGDGELQPIRLMARGAEAMFGMRAIFVAQANEFAVLRFKNGEQSGIIDTSTAAVLTRARYDAMTQSFVADFDPSVLPVSPLPAGQQSYFYGQWVFIPHTRDELPGEGVGTDYRVSDLVRIAFSNVQ